MAERALSVGTVIEKNKIASAVAFIFLAEIEVRDSAGELVETLRLTRNNEDITFQGNLYTAANFDISLKEEVGTIPEIQVVAVDYTRAIQARMQAYGGGVGFDVVLILVNTGNLEQPPEIQERFRVTKSSAQGYVITFTLGAENPLTIRFPRRRQTQDRCQWRYKGPECGYGGTLSSCDLSLQGDNGCAAHGNTMRYGGFPGINSRTR